MVAAFPAEIVLSLKAAGIKKQLRDVEAAGQRIQQRADQIAARWAKIGKGVPTKEFGQVANKLKQVSKLTERIETLSKKRTQRLQGQNSLTSGLLKLNKASVNAARLEAKERADAVSSQKFLNTQLTKTVKLTKAVRSNSPTGSSGGRKKGGGGGGMGGLGAGIGFPLLFGGGPLSVLGGAVGSAGGFGTQILASAIGGIIDAFVADLAKLGGALTEVEGLLSIATEKLLLSSKAREKELKTLAKLGFTDLADSLARSDIENALGKDAVGNLEDLSKEFDEFGRTLSLLTTSLGAFIAGPLAKLLNAINGGNTKDEAVRLFSVSRVREGDARIKEQGATTEAQQIKIRQKVTKEYNTELQKIVAAKKAELAVTTLTNSQKAEAYREAISQVQRSPEGLKGEAGARNAIAGLEITQTLQSSSKKALDIAEKYNNIQKKQQEQQANYDRQRVDTVRSYEQSIAKTRENVEQRILNIRIAGIRKANEIEDQRAANKLSELNLANSQAAQRQRGAAVSNGTNSQLAADSQNIQQAFTTLAEKELSIEQQKAKIKRDTAFTVLQQELAVEKFKIDVAKSVSQLNVDTARKIERINIGIAKKNEDFSEKRFNIEKEIASTQLQVVAQQTVLLGLQVQASGLDAQAQEQWLTYLETVSAEIKAAIDAIDTAKGPAKLNELAPVGGGDVSTAGVDSAAQGLITKERELLDLKLKNLEITDKAAKAAAVNAISNIRLESESKINSILQSQSDELIKQQRIAELERDGLNEAQATAVQAVEAARALSLARLDGLEAAIKTKIADSGDLELVQALRKELEAIAIARGNIESKSKTGIDNAKDLNKELTGTEKIADDVSAQLNNGITDALVGAVKGTQDLGEAFQELASDILAAVGKALILKAITSAIGGVGAPGGGNGTGLMGLLGFAEGGYVTGPTPALVGEGGEPEYMIPASKMDGAMQRYSAGAKGDSVVDGGGSSSNESSSPATVLDVSYSVERINQVDYVTAAEFQQGMNAAAKKGAELGKRQVYSDLTNKRSVRQRLSV